MKRWSGALTALVVLMASVVSAQDTFTAVIVRMAGAPGSDLKRVSARIDGYTGDAEVRELSRILAEGGQKELFAAIQTRSLGFLVVGDGPQWPIRTARVTVTPAGRRIVIATTRPVSGIQSSTPSTEYPFQIVEFDIDADGNGTGRLIEEAQVSIDAGGVVRTDSYQSQPQMLIEVKKAAAPDTSRTSPSPPR